MSTSQQRHQKKLRRASIKKGRGKRPAQSPDTTIGSEAQHHYKRAGSLREQGRFDEAIVSFRKAMATEPRLAAPGYRQIAAIKTHTELDEDVQAMERLYAASDATDEQRMYLAFGLGSAFEDLAQYQKAFEFFRTGNALKRATLGDLRSAPKPRGIAKIANSLGLQRPRNSPLIAKRAVNFAVAKELFEKFPFDRYAHAGCQDATPIFVLGMPRSGTTLVEQILASHSQVHGAGELPDLTAIGGAFLNRFRGKTKAFRQCDAAAFEQVGADYVKSLRAQAESATFIVDKTPENYMFAGLIKLILPNAKVIQCRRDPRDTCMSIFKQLFGSDQVMNYAYDLEEVAQYHNLCRDLMDTWQRLLPEFMYVLNYEELVADQEHQTRLMLNYCGLVWEPACLTFYETNRRIQTRAEQARRPMYDSSVGAWRHYEVQLAPLLRTLN